MEEKENIFPIQNNICCNIKTYVNVNNKYNIVVNFNKKFLSRIKKKPKEENLYLGFFLLVFLMKR